MEVVTVKGGSRDVSPEELAAAMQRGGTVQVAMPQEEAGAELVLDPKTGKMVFNPTGLDPLDLRGMEVEIPADQQNLSFAFGGQPVLLSGPNDPKPEPCQIVGYSLPGGPSFTSLDGLREALAKSNPHEMPSKTLGQSTATKPSAPRLPRDVADPQKDGASSVKAQSVSHRIASPRGMRYRDTSGAQQRARSPSALSATPKPKEPQMLFKSQEATPTSQMYHQKLRPKSRPRPGDICCGMGANVSQSAANVLRATADWLVRPPALQSVANLRQSSAPQRRERNMRSQPQTDSQTPAHEKQLKPSMQRATKPIPRSRGRTSPRFQSFQAGPSNAIAQHQPASTPVRRYSHGAYPTPRVGVLPGMSEFCPTPAGFAGLSEGLIPGVPTRFEKPVSLHPQIPAVGEDGRAQLVLGENELRHFGLDVNKLQTLRSEAALDETPQQAAARVMSRLPQRFNSSPITGPSAESQVQEGLRSNASTRAPEIRSLHSAEMQRASSEAQVLHQYELSTQSGISRIVEKIQLKGTPRIELIRSFASPAECEALNEILKTTSQNPQIPNNLLNAELMTAELGSWLARVMNRIAQLCDVPVESIVGLCPSSLSKGAADATKDFSTIVRLYLDDMTDEGTSSNFPEFALTVKPKLGAALRWDCKLPSGTVVDHHEAMADSTNPIRRKRLLTAYII